MLLTNEEINSVCNRFQPQTANRNELKIRKAILDNLQSVCLDALYDLVDSEETMQFVNHMVYAARAMEASIAANGVYNTPNQPEEQDDFVEFQDGLPVESNVEDEPLCVEDQAVS